MGSFPRYSTQVAVLAMVIIAIHVRAATANAQDDTAWAFVFLWFDMARFPLLVPAAVVPVVILPSFAV